MIPRGFKSKAQAELRSKCTVTGKRAYRSEDAANRALEYAQTQRSLGNTANDVQRAYACLHCSYWHTTSRPPLPMQREAIRPVSAQRAKEQRQRSAMLLEVFGRDPLCARCGKPADDAHELLSRARGGSITSADNIVPLCRGCHSFITTHPVVAAEEGWSLSA